MKMLVDDAAEQKSLLVSVFAVYAKVFVKVFVKVNQNKYKY